jgi:protein phosphatase 4 regulatory subunit 3
VLARAIDDSTFSILNSCILFNQIDIINYVQSDPAFLREIVGIFLTEEMLLQLGGLKSEPPKPTKENTSVDGETSQLKSGGLPNVSEKPALTEHEVQLRRDVVMLIQQLCAMGKNVQLPARMALFRNLSDRGILLAVQWALGQPEDDEQGLQMICTAGEILTTLLDHDVGGVRNHVMKQIGSHVEDKPIRKLEIETLPVLMCRLLARSRDLGVQSQVGESLRIMLEIPQGDAADQHVRFACPGFCTNFGLVFRHFIANHGCKAVYARKR